MSSRRSARVLALAGAPAGAATVARARPGVAATVSGTCVAVGVLLSAALRLQAVLGTHALVWFDSLQFERVGSHPLVSRGFWTADRPPLAPLLWKLTGTPSSYVTLQAVLTVLAWSWLAVTVWDWLGRGIGGAVAAWAVLWFSLTPFVLQWDLSVLSESVSLSAVAVLVAGVLRLAGGVTGPRLAVVVLAGVVLATARDEGVATVALLALGLGTAAAVRAARGARHRALEVVVAAVLLAVVAGGLALAAADAHRSTANVENDLMVRVFPDRGALAWFGAHGMPEVRAVAAVPPDLPVPRSVGAPTVVLDFAAARWAPLTTWIGAHGEMTYLAYLATHPGFVLGAPFRTPPLAFNSPSSLAFYQQGELRPVPLPGPLFPRRGFVAAEAVLAAVALTWRRRRVGRDGVALGALALLGLAAMAVGWFGDGQEVARHMIEGNVTVRLAVLVALLGGLLGPGPRTSRTGGAPVVVDSGGHGVALAED